MNRSDHHFLLDMRESKTDIEYVGDLDYAQFSKDKMRADAVLRRLEILGEAAAKVSIEIQDRYSQVEWSRMYKTRNRLAHEYFRVDLEIVWKIIEDYLPQNLIAIEEVLRLDFGEDFPAE